MLRLTSDLSALPHPLFSAFLGLPCVWVTGVQTHLYLLAGPQAPAAYGQADVPEHLAGEGWTSAPSPTHSLLSSLSRWFA